MIEPADYDPKTTPAIVLGGKSWPIPEMAPRQWRKIRTPLMEMTKRIAAGGRDDVGDTFISLSPDDYDALMLNPIYVALTRAHPAMTFEEFLDIPMTDPEVTLAWFTVRKQSGLFVFNEKDTTEPGEAPAAQ